MSTDRNESFLARWSRRKRSGEPETDPKHKADAPATPADAEPAVPGEAAFDLTKLPRIEDLTPTSDFAQFLQKGVPEDLKRLALRRAWSLDPAIRDFIEVAENQYDWNVVGGAPGFGELDAGTDLKALLLQATGRPPEPREASAEAPADGHPADQSVAVETIADLQVAGPASAAVADETATGDDRLPDAAPADSISAGHPPPSRRGRHGGALAGVDQGDAKTTSR